jgi:hypothetical protein
VSRRLPWLIAGAAGALLAVVLVTGRARAGHPDPRPGITAEQVLPPAAVPRTPGSVESYAAARAVPQVLDGLHCYCDCARHSGHRSLLTCFESEHGGYCDICMGEAVLAQQLTARGEAIDAIRRAVDAQFGS